MTSTDNSARMVTLFAKIIIRVGVLAWFSFLGLYLYYGFSRPTSEQPESGRLYVLNTHGHVAYLTRQEITNLHLLQGVGVGLFLVAGAMALIIKLRQRESPWWKLSSR